MKPETAKSSHTPKYTPGALRAADEVLAMRGVSTKLFAKIGECYAGIISRETHDADLLEALKRIMENPIGYGETFNGSAEAGARPICHECKKKTDLARAAILAAEGTK